AGVGACAPTRVEAALSILSAALLIFSFPDFNFWPLAWVALVPLFAAIARRPQQGRAFLLGWITGVLFFYGSCYWLTHAMIRYGRIPAWVAFLVLVPGAIILGLFPALCSLVLARVAGRSVVRALLLAPPLWVALEWARLGVTGQLWNAIGYSQAYVPPLIQTARWGGVYAVGFLIVAVNAAVAYAVLRRTSRAMMTTAIVILCVAAIIYIADFNARNDATAQPSGEQMTTLVVAVQPNVPMDPVESLSETDALKERHRTLSESALNEWDKSNGASAMMPRVVIWPESPMYFAYGRDSEFRDYVAAFAKQNRVSVIFNSQEPAPANGTYNAAVMINEEGRLVAQYDKIRLLPFGEYVPLPRWLPGVSLIPVLVGDFTPGTDYPLMPLGRARGGVFICFESAFPSIARRFTADGADVLINISNDGYLGQTPVMRQHLANAIFRAVENARPVARVTNTGITAFITSRGEVRDATTGFQAAVRTWTIRPAGGQTFYTRRGDIFVWLCAAIGLLIFGTTLFKKQNSEARSQESGEKKE
ncbi:MAG: apolipoprotein N-acyltransferase, partial [Pyrinomonadaceae bacterium]|nr:apolipoprotein N-acyltransferase [Pyrinomonadaceae bacterium]